MVSTSHLINVTNQKKAFENGKLQIPFFLAKLDGFLIVIFYCKQ